MELSCVRLLSEANRRRTEVIGHYIGHSSFDIFHLSFASHARNLIGSVAVGSVALVYLVTRDALSNDKMTNVKRYMTNDSQSTFTSGPSIVGIISARCVSSIFRLRPACSRASPYSAAPTIAQTTTSSMLVNECSLILSLRLLVLRVSASLNS